MDLECFRNSMHAGLGSAPLYARAHSVAQFRDAILDACLRCYSVDPLSEGTRAGYMLELVGFTTDGQFYSDRLIESLRAGGDDWDAAQRFHFVTYLAMDGDARAREALYESFAPGPESGPRMAIDFVRLDGERGLVFAASKIGALLQGEADVVDIDWLWSTAVDICGEAAARAALNEARRADPNIDAFMACGIEGESRRPRQPSPEEVWHLDYDGLRLVMPKLRRHHLWGWGMRAGDDDLRRAAQGLLGAETPEEILVHVTIFTERAFPLDPQPLFDLATSSDAEVARAASKASANLRHPYMRRLASLIVEEKRLGREEAIVMLGRNWTPGDHSIALEWFRQEQDRQTTHGMVARLQDFWKLHPQPETEPAMLHMLYEKGPCSFCREYVVDRLLELGHLSERERAECALDANHDIREMVGVHE